MLNASHQSQSLDSALGTEIGDGGTLRQNQVRRTGRYDFNKFYWPSAIEDLNWYRDDQIMYLMQELVGVNKRSIQVDEKIWASMEAELEL